MLKSSSTMIANQSGLSCSEDTNRSNLSHVRITDGYLFDLAQREAFDVYVYPFSFIIAYIIVGLVGNGIVLYVFSFKWRRNKNTVFILTLAILDIVSCSVNMPVEAAILYRFIDFDFDILCRVSRFTSYIVSASYSFVLVAIAVDRYIMVCRPFTGMHLNIPFAKRTCIGAVILSLLTQWPSVIFYGTFKFDIPLRNMGPNDTQIICIEANTCLVSNYYVENNTYLYAFYAFLFIGHVIIFVSFVSVYIHIGRNLFMASQLNMNELRTGRRMWKQSVVSAITGAIPKSGLCTRGSRTMSSDNVYTQSRKPFDKRKRRHGRQQSNEQDPADRVSVVEGNYVENSNEFSSEQMDETNLGHVNVSTDALHCKEHDTVAQERCENVNGPEPEKGDRSSVRLSGVSSNSSKRSSVRDSLKLTIGYDVCDINGTDPRLSKTSSGSGGSERPLVPLSPMTAPPYSARPLFMHRSHSEDVLSSRLSATTLNGTRRVSTDIKEISLKQNTLIMRMVTFCFMLSYLPFLVLVFIRYTHPHIPGSLSRVRRIIYHVFLRSYFLNSVMRPFIYIIMNGDYRRKVINLIRCQKV